MGEHATGNEPGKRIRALEAELAALKAQQEVLEADATRWRRLLSGSPIGIAVYRPDGSLKLTNESMKRMFGVSEEMHEWLLANYNILEDEQQVQAGTIADIRRAFAGEHVTLPVVRYVVPSEEDAQGAIYWLQASLAPIRDEGGPIDEIVLVLLDVSAIEEARRQLEDQGQQLTRQLSEVEAVYATSPVGLCLVDAELRYVRINDRMARINGSSVEAHLGRTLREILPDLADRLEPLYRGVLATGDEAVDVEIVGRTPAESGGERTWIANYHPLKTPEGRTWGVSTAVQEITAVKQAECALRESEERFREMADNVRDVFWLFDRLDRRVVYVSPAYEELMRRPAEALYADYREWTRSVHPEDRSRARASLSRLREAGGEAREYRIVRPDGEIRWISDRAFPIRDGDGEVVRVAGIAEDVTERKQAEAALRTSEEHLRTIINHAPAVLWAVDQEGLFTLCEGRGLEAVGLRPGEVVGRSVSDVYAEHAQIQDLVRRALGGETSEALVVIGNVVFEARYAPRRAENGTVIGAFGVAIDVTDRERAAEERRRMQRRVHEAQRLESLGVLAGGIAHDFNNLLMGVLGNADLALSKIPARTPGREYIAQIETTALRAAELTNQMLAYSGQGRFVVEPIDLNRLVEEMGDLLRTVISKKATLKLDLSPSLPTIEADASQIRQIVMNLITNASEALGDEPGIISVRSATQRLGSAYLADCVSEPDLSAGAYVALRVSDTGIGLEPETRRRMFDPFFTTKFAGRGLGLSGVLGIVRGHRGAVRVRSAPGHGTTFEVLFPASDLPVAPSGTRLVPDEVPTTEGSVLVVDDDAMVLDVAEMMLTQAGFSVLLARDGQEAVDVFREHSPEISVVLLDMTMPRLNGAEAAHEIRRIRADIPILLSSGYSEQDARSRFDGQGLAGFVQKPYRARDLLEGMKRALAGAGDPPAGDESVSGRPSRSRARDKQ